LATPDYEQPMQDDLLWVYEGLTQYLGKVLTARSGLWTPDEFRDDVARLTARLDHEPGRTWRNLQDTADFAPELYFDEPGWRSWRRTVDFYDEDVLNWMWVDTIIREQTHGKKSIDDFCHLFHGAPSGPPMVKPYNFDDVVNALNEVAPYDWRSFWTERLTNHDPHAPMTGLENSGWKVIYDADRSELTRLWENDHLEINASYSIGMLLKDDGTIVDTIEGMPAAKAGLGPGMQVIAVNGRQFGQDPPVSPQVLRDALHAAMGSKEPIEFLIENAEYYKTYKIDYHGGEKYPHLVRDESKPDVLSDIIRAR
jgi:predicted metalloprotease with PDZ domain